VRPSRTVIVLADPAVPRLQTRRTVMREWRASDLDAFAAMSADPQVQRFMGGVEDRAQAWRSMALHTGHWLLRGYGCWVVERQDDGVVLGRVGLWEPEGWPGLEVGWKLARHAWGQGFAQEAAHAAMQWAWTVLGATRLISLIDPENTASARVAQRLGMRPDGEHTLFGIVVTVYAIDRAGEVREQSPRARAGGRALPGSRDQE